MKARQLELDLWEQLQLAQQMPEAIDLAQMLDDMEVTAAQLPEADRLRFVGNGLLQIAELCAARAGALMTQWEEPARDPIVERGFFADGDALSRDMVGVLFGGFQLEQRGEFYESPIWVKCSDDQAMTLRQDGQLAAGKLGLAE